MTILDQHVWRQSTSESIAVPPPQQRQGLPSSLPPTTTFTHFPALFVFLYLSSPLSLLLALRMAGSCIATETSVHSKKKLSSQVAHPLGTSILGSYSRHAQLGFIPVNWACLEYEPSMYSHNSSFSKSSKLVYIILAVFFFLISYFDYSETEQT